MKQLTLNELFSGIGAQRKALERIGVDFRVVGISEIDKYAIKSYEAIFGKTFNYGDIRKVERLNYADMWTYSFPCTDISVAGRQAGITKETRSGLLFEVGRLIKLAQKDGTLPKILVLENVKNLVGKKFKIQFDEWLSFLETLGYETKWKVLNAKNFGIPQNRERVFAISILKNSKIEFEFPNENEVLKVRLLDFLEKVVEEKFYVSKEKTEKLIKSVQNNEIFKVKEAIIPCIVSQKCEKFEKITDTALTLLARDYKGFGNQTANAVIIGASRGRNPNNPSDRSLGCPTEQRLEINQNNCTNTITTVQKDNLVIEKILQVGNIIDTKRFGGNPQDGRVYSSLGIAPTIHTAHNPYVLEQIRIRRLTPKECWRLMGFSDDDFEKAKNAGVSDTQLYKQAGNSIVVNVLETVFKNISERDKEISNT